MAIPVKRQVKVLDAKYLKDTQSILIFGECKEGRLMHQINRNCFSFGDRTETQITEEMLKTADMMKGKTITIVFDPDLNGKMDDHVKLDY